MIWQEARVGKLDFIPACQRDALEGKFNRGRYGITVNIVSPGPIQTGYITTELEQRVIADTPLGRVGQPEDVADVIVFLASEQAHWLTGQLLFVGGGHRMV